MNEEMKELISRYVDGQVSTVEKEIVEDQLAKSSESLAYFKELNTLKKVLNEWPVEGISRDWEEETKRKLAVQDAKEEVKMKKISFSRVGFGGGILLMAMVVIVFSLQTHVKREMQGRYKQAVDDIGSQSVAQNSSGTRNSQPATTSQYQPYYLSQTYDLKRQEGQTESLQASATVDSGARYASKAKRMNMAAQGMVATEQTSYWGQPVYPVSQPEMNTEEYGHINENRFLEAKENPLSTFSIDVDTASYANLRRFLQANQLPPQDALRIEEMVNYFDYTYPQPKGEDPFSITLKGATCPWNTKHQLVMVGLHGKTLDAKTLPPSNLVFLIDTSGSMMDVNKLPLLKQAFKMMVGQLTEKERVSIVVYAGAAGKVLDSTPGNQKQKIYEAIDQLQAGGSTAGGAGIQLAYELAKENLIANGNNRVILATDGDFNVGVSSDGELVRLIEDKRKEGIFLTVLGFGMGNYKDAKMEQLADKGNGNYYYIDTQKEAQKVLVSELGSTLFTIAKDVKIQIEFNPAKVKAYKLIGYENRLLAKEDFNDDTKDAGELGAGHTVTALYEIVPVDSKEEFRKTDELTYQQTQVVASNDLMTVKFRYKEPSGDTSKLITQKITEGDFKNEPDGDFKFAAAVAEFGLLLRRSEFKDKASYEHVIKSAGEAKGEDKFGYREEFINLVKAAKLLDIQTNSSGINFKGGNE